MSAAPLVPAVLGTAGNATDGAGERAGAALSPQRSRTLALLGCQPLIGHLPGFRQPALLAEFVLTAQELPLDTLARLDARLGEAIPAYAERPAPAFLAEHALLQRVVRLHLALLTRARCPLSADGALLAGSRDGTGRMRLRLALPCLGQDTPWMHALLGEAISIVGSLAAGRSLSETAFAQAGQLATMIAPRGFNSAGLLASADRRQIPWTRLSDNVMQFGWGARARLLDSTFTDVTPNIGVRLARDKFATASTLRRAGLPVPVHMPVRDAEQAVQAARRIGWPVVVKPQDSDGGRGVTVNLRDEATLREAFAMAAAESPHVLVERHIEGNDYRLQVFNGEVFWAVHRKPGGVTGDGQHTVAELLATLNADPKRGLKGSGLVLKRIEMNGEARRLLAEQGLADHDVPAAGQFVRLRLAANVGNGGTPIPVLEQTHPDNLALGARAARLLRLDLAGIDVLMPDITRSWLETGAAIIEVNAQPQVSPHLHDWLMERLVPGQGRIPVVGVVGDGEVFVAIAEAVRRAAHERGEAAGLGVAGGGGATLGGQRVGKDTSVVFGAQALLADPACSAMLLHLDARQRPSRLLPVDRFDALWFAGAPGTPAVADAGPTAFQADWLAHAAVLANASAAVWADAAHPEWLAASAAWPQPVQRLLGHDDAAECLLALLNTRAVAQTSR